MAGDDGQLDSLDELAAAVATMRRDYPHDGSVHGAIAVVVEQIALTRAATVAYIAATEDLHRKTTALLRIVDSNPPPRNFQ